MRNLISTKEVAELFGVKQSTVDVWKNRTNRGLMSPPFPPSVECGMCGAGARYPADKVREWGEATGREMTG